MMDRILVFKDDAGFWRWHRQAAGNNEVISSGESHTRRDDAERAAVRANPDGEFEMIVEADE